MKLRDPRNSNSTESDAWGGGGAGGGGPGSGRLDDGQEAGRPGGPGVREHRLVLGAAPEEAAGWPRVGVDQASEGKTFFFSF